MKSNVSFCDFSDKFRDMGRKDSWSYSGLKALYEYLEEFEAAGQMEVEFDVIAIDCEYCEYGDLQEWAEDYLGDWKEELSIEEDADDDDMDEDIRKYIWDNGTLIEFNGGIIVSSF